MTQTAQAPAHSSPLDHLASACKAIALAGLVVITLVQAWQVFARYVLNNSPGWTEPVSVFFMGMTVMMAAAVGVREGTHFSFSNVLDAMGPRMGKVVRVVLDVITTAVAGLLAYWGFLLAVLSWDVMMAGAALPAGVRYLPFAIGATIMAIFSLERLALRFKGEGH